MMGGRDDTESRDEIYSPGRVVKPPEWYKQKIKVGVSRESMEVTGEEQG